MNRGLARARWRPIVATIGLILLLASSFGCASVKPWEKEVLARQAMSMDDLPCQRFERNSEVYREGAVGANGGKSGGGCGCN